MKLFEIFGEIKLKDDGVKKKLDDADKGARTFGDRLGDVARKVTNFGAIAVAGVGVASGAIFALSKPLVEAAAGAQAMNSQFEQVFKDMQTDAQATINTLGEDFGMLPNRIKPAFTTMTSMFKGLGMDTEEAMSTAEGAVTMVADAAAFYDKSFEDANSALNSFIKGKIVAPRYCEVA